MPRWVAPASLALSLSLVATDASGWCLKKFNANKPYAAWQTMPVEYRVSDTLTDPKMLAAIDAAFQTWGSVQCSKLKFTKGAQFPLASVKFDHATPYIYVFWHVTSSTLFANPGGQPFFESTYVWQDNIGGIVGGSIAVNAFDYKWNAEGGDPKGIFDVQNAMTYMIGTVIGLTDSTVAGAAMENNVTYGQTSKRTLTQDDRDGLVYLYKESSCTAPPAPNASGCSTGTTPPVGDGKKDGGVTPGKEGGVPPGKEGGVPPGKEGGVPGTDAGGQKCTRSEDCPSGQSCTAEGTCVSTGGGDDGGCCRVSHARDTSGVFLAAAALALLWGLRRRRRQ